MSALPTTSALTTIDEFISKNDNGSAALLYPSRGFLELVVSVLKFLNSNISITRHWTRPKFRLIQLLTPHVRKSGKIFCGCEDEAHSDQLVAIVVNKLVSVYLGNYAKAQSDLEDVPKCSNKPFCLGKS